MSTTTSISLDEIMASRSGSVDPSKFPGEVFDLYSVPAYESGRPDVFAGRDIGSAKQVVEPGDVLLSRIVPHIRRAWVVGKNRGRRMIGSGEWIVFRSKRFCGSYLRYLLVTDQFHARFMQTVSGVGGSLLRARPAQVADIEIRLPALSEQQRIARLLDQAGRLRRTRRFAVELSDTFLAAAFVSLFGNPAKNPKYPLVPLGELIVSGPQNGLYKHASAYGSGTRIVRIDAYQNSTAVGFAELQRVRLSSDEIATYGLLEGDFLINRVNSRTHLGKSTVVPHLSEPAVYESNMMRFRVDDKRLRTYP